MTENEKMDLILRELGGIKEDVGAVKREVRLLTDDVKSVKEEVQLLKDDVKSVKEEVQLLKDDVKSVKEEVQLLKNDVKSVKDKVISMDITLENETNRNIQLIAEGHLNLDRKLDEALKELHPNTMYHLKVNHLDGEVTKMKRVLNMA